MGKRGYQNTVRICLRVRDRKHIFTQKTWAKLTFVLNAASVMKALDDYLKDCGDAHSQDRQAAMGRAAVALCAALFGDGLTKGLLLTYEGRESELGGELARMIRRMFAACGRFVKREMPRSRENLFDIPVFLFCRANGIKWKFKGDCQSVLAAMAILKDGRLPQNVRISRALTTLTAAGARGWLPLMCVKTKEALLGGIFTALSEEGGKTPGAGGQSRAIIDPAGDAPLIYADFLAFYHVDLRKERVAWRQFAAMVAALPHDSALQSALAARANTDKDDYRRGVERLFGTLMGMAGKKREMC